MEKACYFQQGEGKFLITTWERQLTRRVCRQGKAILQQPSHQSLVLTVSQDLLCTISCLSASRAGLFWVLLNVKEGFHCHRSFQNPGISLMISVFHCGVPWISCFHVHVNAKPLKPLNIAPFYTKKRSWKSPFPYSYLVFLLKIKKAVVISSQGWFGFFQ